MKKEEKERRSKGAGTLFTRGKKKKYYLKYTVNGKHKTICLETTLRKEAEEKAKEFRPIIESRTKEEIAAHVAVARKIAKPKTSLPLSDIWNSYLKSPLRPDSGQSTLVGYKSRLDNFIEWMEKHHIQSTNELKNDIVLKFFSSVWDRGISERTYNSYLQALKLIFKNISKQSGIEEDIFEGLKKKSERQQSRKEFTESEVEEIFKAFDDKSFYLLHKEEMCVMLSLACWTGARGQDACLMKWKNIDFKNNQITYIPTKTAGRVGKEVTLPLHPDLREKLNAAKKWKIKDNPFILPKVADRYKRNHSGISKDTSRILQHVGLETSIDPGEGVRRKTYKNKDNKLKKMKVCQYSMHSFRHTFVSFCANASVPLAVVQDIVGHTSPAMTRHYTHISNEAKKKAINALPGANNALDSAEKRIEKVLNLLENRESLTESEKEILSLLKD